MTKRKQVRKTDRFEVFKRDGFVCQYCGRRPPLVILEIDHISPVSKGGGNDINNLLTACFDCNRGKSDKSLLNVPQSVTKKAEVIEEKELQLKEYNKLLSSIRRRENYQIRTLENIFREVYSDLWFSSSFKESIRLNFIQKLDKSELQNSMHIALMKTKTGESTLKYFCGVCWNKINQAKQDG